MDDCRRWMEHFNGVLLDFGWGLGSKWHRYSIVMEFGCEEQLFSSAHSTDADLRRAKLRELMERSQLSEENMRRPMHTSFCFCQFLVPGPLPEQRHLLLREKQTT